MNEQQEVATRSTTEPQQQASRGTETARQSAWTLIPDVDIYEDVLNIRIPKRAEAKPRRIEVKTG